jgi:flagellar protein FliL
MPETATNEKQEETAKSEPAAETEKKSSGFMKMVVVLGIMQVTLAVGAFFVVKMVVIPKAAASTQKPVIKVVAEKKEPGEIFLIENILVNPAGTNGTRYLSTSIGLELEKNEKAAERLKEMTPIARDILIAVFSSKTLDELGSTEGKEVVRKEILERINQAITPEKVTKVYFVDYVLQ